MKREMLNSEENITIEIKDFVEQVYEKTFIEEVEMRDKLNTGIDDGNEPEYVINKKQIKSFDNGDYGGGYVYENIKDRFDCFGMTLIEEKIEVLCNFFDKIKEAQVLINNNSCLDKNKKYLKHSNTATDLSMKQLENERLRRLLIFYNNLPKTFFSGLKKEDVKKVLRIEKKKFQGNIYIGKNKITIREEERIEIGIKDSYTNRVVGILRLPLTNIFKSGKHKIMAIIKTLYTEKETQINVKFEGTNYNFLGKKYTDWCTSNINQSLPEIFTCLKLYSLMSLIETKTLARYFLELQMKLNLGTFKINFHTLSQGLFFYNYLFGADEIYKPIEMLMNYIKLKICTLGEKSENLLGHVNLYCNLRLIMTLHEDKENIQKSRIEELKHETILKKCNTIEMKEIKTVLSLIDSDKNINSNSNNNSTITCKYTEELKIDFTNELISIDEVNVKNTIKLLYDEIYKKKTENVLFLIDKISIKVHVQKLLYKRMKFFDDVFMVFLYINQIEKLLEYKIITKNNILELHEYYDLAIKKYLNIFYDTLKIIIKDIINYEETKQEINYLYDGLFVFIKNQDIIAENYFGNDNQILKINYLELIKKIMILHFNNFNKMHKKYRKGILKNKIIIINFSKRSFEKINKISNYMKLNIMDFRLDYLIREKEEILRMLSHYKKQMLLNSENFAKINSLIQNILERCKELNKSSYKLLRFSLHGLMMEFVHESFIIEQIRELNENYYSRKEEICEIR
ncbi:hypothetical protein COBT_001380 [Conglomerata obtusa]